MFRLSIFLILLVVSSAASKAQSAGELDPMYARPIAQWKMQQAAAERDVQLVKQVFVAFLAAAKPFDKNPSVAAVNSALAPLKKRYPDYRLNYRSAADICRIERAIGDARSAALTRSSDALSHQLRLLSIAQAHAAVSLKLNTANLLDKPLTDKDIYGAFQQSLPELSMDDIQTDWGSMDYISESSGLDDDCN